MAAPVALPEPAGVESPGTSPARLAWRSFWRRRPNRLSLCFLVGLVFLSVATPFLPLPAPGEVHLDAKLSPPTLEGFAQPFKADPISSAGGLTGVLMRGRVAVFGDWQLPPLLGTDALGRCLLSRILWGARLSLLVGAVASLISLVIGVLWGAVAGYAGGRADTVMMRAVDILYALPIMFLVIFSVALLRGYRNANPDADIDQIVLLFVVIGATSWLIMARIVRGQVVSLRHQEFMEAARASGSGPVSIVVRHVLPNVTPVVIVTLTLTVPRIMLFEAFLSFLGLGVEAPDVSWGVLTRQGFDALTAVHTSLWLILFPGIAFASTLLSMNILGDGLRDAFDPRLRGMDR